MDNLDIGGGKANRSSKLLAFDDYPAEFVIPSQELPGHIHLSMLQSHSDFGAGYTDVVNVFSGDLLQFKTIFLPIGQKVLKPSFPVFTKTVVISNHQNLCADFIQQYPFDEFLRTKL